MSAFLDGLVARWRKDETWPPPHLRKRWTEIASYRRRYENNRGELLKANPNLAISTHKTETFVPVPFPRELCRFSASLLFSETPRVIRKDAQDEIDELEAVNDFGAFAVEAGVKAACEGRIGVRVIRDPEVDPKIPLLTVVSEDQIIWHTRHGRFVVGGIVVIEKEDDSKSKAVYRLLEEHSPGAITRYLFKGDESDIGRRVPLGDWPEYAHLPEFETTQVDRPTLIPWENIPGGESDLFGLGPLFDTLNESESLLLDKARKTIPRLFADRSLTDSSGRFQIDGIIITGGSRMRAPLGTNPMELVKLVDAKFDSKDNIGWIDHLQQLIVTCAGYSPMTWGIQGHTANVTRAVSGYAMKLAQLRTLLTRSGKEHMALEAMGKAIATAVALQRPGPQRVSELLPSIELGDGLPPDPLDGAQEVLYLSQAKAASLESMVKIVHPTWSIDEVNAEVARIMEASAIVGGVDGTGPAPGLAATLAAIARQQARERPQREEAGNGDDPAEGVD